ncbi:MAG: hydrolase [Candidatus Adlerbacteria bacterium]|nr:hydrolase [Candidatus Adlerbacteria bacterium]
MSAVLLTLSDKDIFPNTPDTTGTDWKDRPTGKVVLFNDKNEIVLVSNKITNLFLLPGGGIEEGEDIVEGTKRECREETGHEIEIIHELGVTEDYRVRDSRHCISYCFAAKALSQGPIALTKDESDIGFFMQWFSLEDAAKLLASQEEKVRRGEVEFYNTCFNIVRDSFFIRRAQKLLA